MINTLISRVCVFEEMKESDATGAFSFEKKKFEFIYLLGQGYVGLTRQSRKYKSYLGAFNTLRSR